MLSIRTVQIVGNFASALAVMRDVGSCLVWNFCQSSAMGFRQASGYLCGSLFCGRADCCEGPLSSVPYSAHLCGGRADRRGRICDYSVEGVAAAFSLLAI